MTIGGIKLFDGDIQNALNQLLDTINLQKKETLQISLTGAHGIVIAQSDNKFMEVLNSCYMNLPDGMPGVWVAKLKGAKKIKRCYGPDFFKATMLRTASRDLGHFFLGGREGVADDLRESVHRNFGNLNIVGTLCPPFHVISDSELKEIASKINDTNPDFLWIGISTPKQEKLAYRLKELVSAKFIITVGAAFDFHTGRLTNAPTLIQNLGMEWLFRLVMEPRRLFSRYLIIVPHFIVIAIKEIFSVFNENSNSEKRKD